MKLHNKKTGEIADLSDGSINTNIDGGSIIVFSSMRPGKYQEFKYASLSELNEDWEDYEPNDDYLQIHFDGSDIVDEDKYGVHTITELCGDEE